MSSTNDVVVVGETKRRRSIRRQKQAQDALETRQKQLCWLFDHVQCTSDRPNDRTKRRKRKHRSAEKSTKKSNQAAVILPDLRSNKELPEIPRNTGTDICITGTYSLADVRTKSDAEKFVKNLKKSLKQPRSSKRTHFHVGEDNNSETERLKMKVTKLEKRNIELEMVALNLHRHLKEIIASQERKSNDGETKIKSLKRNQQEQEKTKRSQNFLNLVPAPLQPNQVSGDIFNSVVENQNRSSQQKIDNLIQTLLHPKEPNQRADINNGAQHPKTGSSEVTTWVLPWNTRNSAECVFSACESTNASKTSIFGVQTEGIKELENNKVVVPELEDYTTGVQTSSPLQANTEFANANNEKRVRYIPITKPPIFSPFSDAGPSPPSYEVALTVYPPSEPWQHLQHIAPPREMQTNVSPYGNQQGHQAFSSGNYWSQFSHLPTNSTHPLILLPCTNFPTLPKRSKNHKPDCQLDTGHSAGNGDLIPSQTLSKSYSGARQCEMMQTPEVHESSKERHILPLVSKDRKITVHSSKYVLKDKLLKNTADVGAESNTEKSLLQCSKQPNKPTISSPATCSEDFKGKMPVTTSPVVGGKEGITKQELFNGQQTQEVTLSVPACVSQSWNARNLKHSTTIPFCFKSKFEIKSNSLVADDADASRCNSPEFPPPTQMILKKSAENSDYKRGESSQIISVKDIPNEMHSSVPNVSKDSSTSTSAEGFIAKLPNSDGRKATNEAGKSSVKSECLIPQGSISIDADRVVAFTQNTNNSSKTNICGEQDADSFDSNSFKGIEKKSNKKVFETHKATDHSSYKDFSLLTPVTQNAVEKPLGNCGHLSGKATELMALKNNGAVASEMFDRDGTRKLAIRDEGYIPEPQIKEVYSLKDQRLIPPIDLSVTTIEGGVVLSWNLPRNANREFIKSYEILGRQFQADIQGNPSAWKRMGMVPALAPPMACTLTHFKKSRRYCFAVRAVGIHNQQGPLSENKQVFIGSI